MRHHANTLIGALTAVVIGGIALSQPAQAGSIQHRGDFGGTWSRIGPSDNYRTHRRHYYGAPIYVAPSYAYDLDYGDPYYYGPPDYYDYGPGIAIGPGIGLSIGVD